MKRLILLLATSAFVAVSSAPVDAYLKLGVQRGTSIVTLHWDGFPVTYFVTAAGASGVSAEGLRDAVGRAFSTWEAVDTADTSFSFGGFTAARPNDDDTLTVIGFLNRPEQDRTLAATSFLVNTATGEIIESDIYFNSAFSWSIAGAGEQGRFDVESIALHEIGHLLGLGHSAIGETEVRSGGRAVIAAEAVMFPIAFSTGSIVGRTLRADDIAGVSDIYPNALYRSQRGSISGRVVKNGSGVFGAHVVAFNARTGKMVGGFALNAQGSFVIAGLDAGPYVLRVEPLDDGDIESFFDLTLNVDVNFRPKFHDRLAVVPAGGGVSNIEIRVEPK